MATVSITESDVLTALRTFILSLVTCEVVRGLGNRDSMPAADFVCTTPISSSLIETPSAMYQDGSSVVMADGTPVIGAPSSQVTAYPGSAGYRFVMSPRRLDVQIDCYGATAFDNATALSTMLRSEYACESFAASGIDAQPLYADDPKQLPFVNGEDQYEERWMFVAALQFNPVVTVPQDFAASLNINFVSVDANYKP